MTGDGWTSDAQIRSERDRALGAVMQRLEAQGRTEAIYTEKELADLLHEANMGIPMSQDDEPFWDRPGGIDSERERARELLSRTYTAALTYLLIVELEQTTVDNAERRKQLAGMEQTAADLRERIRSLDPVIRNQLENSVDIDAIYQALGNLSESARSERHDGIAKPRRGRRVPMSRQILMGSLCAVWERFTGERPGYTNVSASTAYTRGDEDVYEGSFDGPFLRFAKAAAVPIMGADFNERDFAEWVKHSRSVRQ